MVNCDGYLQDVVLQSDLWDPWIDDVLGHWQPLLLRVENFNVDVYICITARSMASAYNIVAPAPASLIKSVTEGFQLDTGSKFPL